MLLLDCWLDEDGMLSDVAVSNNSDMETVLATVIATIPLFFEKFENATLFFQGSTKSRTRLYRVILNKYITDIRLSYNIKALKDGQVVEFNANDNFDGFFIFKK